ncbi:MAG: hypothetical protein Q8903_07055 [Bacteroidota bacterium]|nr:hypothetical protein [Bacteroidota bacterium]
MGTKLLKKTKERIEEEEKWKRKYCLSYHLDRVSSLAYLLSRSFEIAFAGDMVGDMAKFLEAFEFLEEEIKLIKVKAEEELYIAIDKI